MAKIKHYLRQLIHLPGFWFCILAFAMLFTILSKQEFWTGYDTYFHMNTIYEDAMQIKTGHFSYFISMFGFERSGRIVNSLYGPFFNYFCGALLLLCHSWITFEFVLFFATMVICGYGLYGCARLLKISRVNATILGMLYMVSRPMIVRWLGNFEFTGLGASVLLPFVIMVGIKIFQQHRIKVIPLSLVMAVCLQIHLITSLVAGLILIPFVFGGFVMSRRKWRMISNGVLSILLSFCLSGNVFGALYDLYHTTHVIPTFPNFNLQTTSGGKAISVQGHTITDLGHLYTFLLGVIFLLFVVRLFTKSSTRLEWCFLIEDGFFLWMSSAYFPWDRLLRIWPNLASIIQFPSRFVSVTFIITILLVGQVVTAPSFRFKGQLAVSIFLILMFVCAFWPSYTRNIQMSQGWDSNEVVKYWPHHVKYGGFRYRYKGDRIRAAIRSHDLGKGVDVVHKITTDYLPTDSHDNIYTYYKWPTDQVYVQDFKNQFKYHKFTQNHELNMDWWNRGTRQIRVPLVKYGNTVVMLNHRRVSPTISIIGTMKIRPRNGLNVMSIRYQPGHIFKLMSTLTILAWLLVIGILIKLRIKSK